MKHELQKKRYPVHRYHYDLKYLPHFAAAEASEHISVFVFEGAEGPEQLSNRSLSLL